MVMTWPPCFVYALLQARENDLAWIKQQGPPANRPLLWNMAGGRPHCDRSGIITEERPPPAANLQQLLGLLHRALYRERLHFTVQKINPCTLPVVFFSLYLFFGALVKQFETLNNTPCEHVASNELAPGGSFCLAETLLHRLLPPLHKRQRAGSHRGEGRWSFTFGASAHIFSPGVETGAEKLNTFSNHILLFFHFCVLRLSFVSILFIFFDIIDVSNWWCYIHFCFCFCFDHFHDFFFQYNYFFFGIVGLWWGMANLKTILKF